MAAEVAPGQQVRCGACQAVVTVPATGVESVGTPSTGTSFPPTVPLPRPPGPPVQTGLAVASLVCGIIGLVICMPLGIAGLIMGIVALVRANREPGRYGGRGLAIAGVCTGAASLLLVPLMLTILLPLLTQAREQSKRLVCASNLTGIARAIQIYADQYDGEFPADLQVLVDGGDVMDKQLICPSSGAVPGDPIDSCYIYIPGQNEDSDSRNVLIYEKPGNHANEGGNVAFVDGHATFERPYSEVEKRVAETKARLAKDQRP